MITAKIVKKKGNLEKILKNLNSLSKNNVQVGHFEDSGIHTGSDLTHTELLKLWSVGLTNSGVIKNPLAAFAFTQLQNKKFLKNPKIQKVFKKFSKNLLQGSASETFLMEIGLVLREEYSELFGKAGLFMPIVGDNTTPLLDTGELKSKSAYKTSYNNKVNEVGG